MSPKLPLARLVASLWLALPEAATAHDFSVDPPSPEVLQFRYGSSDIVDQTGGGPVHFAANLGLGSDELDGFSYGKDLLVPVSATAFVSLQFSVSPATTGAGGVVTNQRNGNGAAGDKFFVLRLRNQRWVGPSLESDAPNHKLTPLPPQQSNIDGLSFPAGTRKGIFWTVARGGVRQPSDVYYVADPGVTPPVLYATTAQLGLLATDNIDAIAIKDGGTIGVLDAGDIVYASLDTASPTRTARGGQDDILQLFPGPIIVAVPFNRLDITAAATEEIDAITAYDPDRPFDVETKLPASSFNAGADITKAPLNYVIGYTLDREFKTVDFDALGNILFPPRVIPTPPGSEPDTSAGHPPEGGSPFDRGTGYSLLGAAAVGWGNYFGGAYTHDVVSQAGDLIPGGGTIANFFHCSTAEFPWGSRAFVSTLFSDTGQMSVGGWYDHQGSFDQFDILLRQNQVVGPHTILNIGGADVMVSPEDANVLNVIGTAQTNHGPAIWGVDLTWSGAGIGFGAPEILADSSTMGTGGLTNWTYFGSVGDAGSSFALHAQTASGTDGIFVLENGALRKVADRTTPVPSGVGNFTGFQDRTSLDEGAVTFIGSSAVGTGIYTNLTGRLKEVVRTGDVVEGRTVSSVVLSRDAAVDETVVYAARFTDGYEGIYALRLPKPFDTTSVTQRAIHVDVELDPDPSILGPDPRALLVGDLGTARLRGIWKSNGTLGTVTIPGREVARLLALQFGPATTGGIGEWVITVDVASGAIVSSTASGALANGPFALNSDTNGGPWTSPLIAGGIPGTSAGFETDGGGRKLFCSNAFSQLAGSACGTGAFGSPAPSAYDRASGFVHMTGPLTLGNAVLWGFLGDQRWLEAPASACPDLDSDGVCDAVDNCMFEPNAGQQDAGGIGAASAADGRGDACQCGDVSGNGRVTSADATLVLRSNLVPPTSQLAVPDACNVGGSAACTTADATIMTRANLVPPTATLQNACTAAAP